jgi:hypothetical protein
VVFSFHSLLKGLVGILGREAINYDIEIENDNLNQVSTAANSINRAGSAMTNMFGTQEIDIPFSNFLHRDTATQVSLQIMRHSEAFDIELIAGQPIS